MDLRPLKQFPEKFLRYLEVLRLHQELGFGAKRLAKICGLPTATIHRYIKGRTKPYKCIPEFLIVNDELKGHLSDAFLFYIAAGITDTTKPTNGYKLVTTLSSFSLAVPLYLAYLTLGLKNIDIKIDTVRYRYRSQLLKTEEVSVYLLSHLMSTLCRRIYQHPEILALTEEESIKLIRFAYAFDGSVECKERGHQIVISFFEKPHILKFFENLLLRFGIHSKIILTKGLYPSLVVWRKDDVERFSDMIGIFGWKGVKLEDYLTHRSIYGKITYPEHYILREPLGHVPPEVAILYDALKTPMKSRREKLRLLFTLYNMYFTKLFTQRDLHEFKHLILPDQSILSFQHNQKALTMPLTDANTLLQ